VTSGPAQPTGNLQNNKASGDADAKKKIQELHKRLQSGEDFGAVAMNFSENPNTNSNGGDMGFIPESQLRSDPEVYNAIGKLKPGEITEVLPAYDGAGPGHHAVGYAIYKLIAREPAGQRELNDPRVQQAIRQGLRENTRNCSRTPTSRCSTTRPKSTTTLPTRFSMVMPPGPVLLLFVGLARAHRLGAPILGLGDIVLAAAALPKSTSALRR
jgi:hypothetical protein